MTGFSCSPESKRTLQNPFENRCHRERHAKLTVLAVNCPSDLAQTGPIAWEFILLVTRIGHRVPSRRGLTHDVSAKYRFSQPGFGERYACRGFFLVYKGASQGKLVEYRQQCKNFLRDSPVLRFFLLFRLRSNSLPFQTASVPQRLHA